MAEPEPKWLEDFPVAWSEDHYVVRREFAKFLVLGSLGLAFGNVWLWGRGLLAVPPPSLRLPVAAADELPVGGVKLFRYPGPGDPAILIRLGPDRFVAYGQKCTHLSCAVYYDHGRGEIVCPCHHGYFDPASGAPTAGPPARPLTRIELAVAEGRVYALGVRAT